MRGVLLHLLQQVVVRGLVRALIPLLSTIYQVFQPVVDVLLHKGIFLQQTKVPIVLTS